MLVTSLHSLPYTVHSYLKYDMTGNSEYYNVRMIYQRDLKLKTIRFKQMSNLSKFFFFSFLAHPPDMRPGAKGGLESV